MPLNWKIDECAEYYGEIILRGWCHQSEPRIVSVSAIFSGLSAIVQVVSFGQPSPDVAEFYGVSAANCRFDQFLALPDTAIGRDFYLRFFCEDGSSRRSGSALANAADGDPYAACWLHFADYMRALPGGTVLEIGSRARSAVTRRQLVRLT
ncbi:MAG: hypothetical protein Q7S40_10300 [Opitutaceae bacterium]|nr:hypothetical protein [Opitutaceae bacterium]